ncbi:DUF885 domain-containing protein [Bermanella marisrubri]|nr:DUF885 domain-containing protein [Bermanella marisrubri]QIZ84408.1 DUF885 domain-containing protein [Bermanella marisrubri]
MQSEITNAQPQFSSQEIQQAEQNTRELMARYKLWREDSSPMLMAYRGQKQQYDQWDDLSLEFEESQYRDLLKFQQQIMDIQEQALPSDLKLSLRILDYQVATTIEGYQYRLYNYPLNQMFGLHTEIPNFLINIHRIDTIKDARDFISRVWGVEDLFDDLLVQIRQREEAGIIPPRFVMESVINASEKILEGYPIQRTDDEHMIWIAFKEKIAKLNLYTSTEKVLESDLKRALQRGFKRGYQSLIKHYKTVLADASLDTGFSQFDGGNAYYQFALRSATTTNMDAETLHQLGKQQIQVIHQEITDLLPQLGFTTLDELFKYTRTDDGIYYNDGKQAISDTKEYIRTINTQLGNLFLNIPNIGIEVRPVESYREDSAPIAFYQSPSEDGSRPGRYYMNLNKLNEMPKFQFEALTYHETLPGHHLQIIYAQQSKNIPAFRRHIHFTAYSEGWGLYAEKLGKELGGFKNPWNEYGRLLMNLWRAMRLVLDTGLHHYGWTLEEALAYRLENTPFSEQDSINAIKRYLVMPGQATAYMVGKLKLEQYREQTKQTVGFGFDERAYHTHLLEMGPMPLSLLESELEKWAQQQ